MHTGEATVISNKISQFLAVTTRPIPHSGGCACIRNCVGEFGMDTGKLFMISN